MDFLKNFYQKKNVLGKIIAYKTSKIRKSRILSKSVL